MLDIYNELYEDIDEELIDDSNMFDVDEQDIEDDILLEAEDDYDDDEYMDNLASQLEEQVPYDYEVVATGRYLTVRPTSNRSVPALEIDTQEPGKSTIEFNDFFDFLSTMDTISVYLSEAEEFQENLQSAVKTLGETMSTYVDIFNSYVEMTK